MRILVLVGLLLAACGSDRHPCSDGGCVCEAESSCGIDCDDDDCNIACQDVSDCDVTCGDFCDFLCADTSNCDLRCDDVCTATCDAVSNCDVDCGLDCDVDCASVSNCRVTMLSGIVTCEDVSNCTVSCVVPGGTEPATSCGGGLFACGPCP